MRPSHDISGLIAWSRREEWREPMSEVFIEHIARACDAAGIAPDELPQRLEPESESTVWGAAFEDLLTRDLPDGRNLADEYLRRRAWRESTSVRGYIAALRRSVISLYEVSNIVPGQSMLLRDLIRGGEPVRVNERLGTQSVRPWDRVATRVLTLPDGNVLSGTLLGFPAPLDDTLLTTLKDTHRASAREAAKIARSAGIATDARAMRKAVTLADMLPRAASLITNLWLGRLLAPRQGLTLPALHNSEGDPLALMTLHFPLRPGVAVDEVAAALGRIPELTAETGRRWTWLGTRTPSLASSPPGLAIIGTNEQGALVLGSLRLGRQRLELEVNSKRRAERGEALLRSALGDLIGPALREQTDLQEVLAKRDAADGPPAPSSGLPLDQERAIIHQTLERHYRDVLDQPIPMLGDRTPREACRSAKGRQAAAEWLKSHENTMARYPEHSPMAGYDLSWVWQELGILALRR